MDRLDLRVLYFAGLSGGGTDRNLKFEPQGTLPKLPYLKVFTLLVILAYVSLI